MEKQIKVLQIEDNADDALLILRSIRKFGYQVEARRVETDRELAQALQDGVWDIVLSDYAMPNFDGMTALGLIKERTDLPFILVSGAVGEETAVEIMKAGAHDFIIKERLDRLGLAVERVLRETAALKAKEENERILQAIMKGMARATGPQAFRNILSGIGEWLGVEHGMVAKLLPGGTVETVALSMDGKPAANIKYEMNGTPCAQVASQGLTLISGHLREHFPTPRHLAVLEAESFLGLPLLNQHQEMIGVLAFLSRRTITPPDRFRLILELAADRVASELERLQRDSEHQRLEEQLRHAQKMEAIGTMSGGIAHDFNNILTGIIGYSEMARNELGELPGVQRKIDKVLQAGHRAKELVQHILTFSRHSDDEKKAVDLSGICHEAIKLLRASIPTSIEFSLAIAKGCTVMAVPSQMHQIIMNLCTNAYQAMANSGGQLTVTLSQCELDGEGGGAHNLEAGTFARLQVSDTGQGMTPEVKERIFEPYFTTKDKGVGTGLGLALIHGIVNGHNGGIEVESEVGHGATFTIWLPLLKEVRAEGNTDHEQPALAMGTERVLLVDDEELIQQFSKEMLALAGYRVTTAGNGQEALELFRKDPTAFDLILTDMTMPKMSGLELARQAMAIRPGMPVILCSGYNDQVSKDGALGAGVREYLIKPVAGLKLCSVIRAVLDGKG